jgi:hypothetical protein
VYFINPGAIAYVSGTVSNLTINDTGCVCLHPETLIRTVDGNKTINSIKSGDYVYKPNGDLLRVEYNIKNLVPTKKFIKLSKGCLENNLPENDLYITAGHPIIINDEEIECQKLVNGTTIEEVELDEKVNVYTICATERTAIMIEGLPILTFEEKEWIETSIKYEIPWIKANDDYKGSGHADLN